MSAKEGDSGQDGPAISSNSAGSDSHAINEYSSRYEIAEFLDNLARIIRSGEGHAKVEVQKFDDLPSAAREIYSLRRRRVAIMKEAAIADGPAWDILLDLFVHMDDGRPVSVTSAAIGAGCPPTTALRWLQALQEQDLIVRIDDPTDHRRTFVELSPHGRDLMIEILSMYVSKRRSTSRAKR